MSEDIKDQIAVVLAEVKKMADEINQIRVIMAENLERQIVQNGLAETNAEIAMVDTLGIDPVQYLRDKSRKHRAARQSTKRIRHDSPMV